MTVGIYGIFDSKTDECLYIGLSKNIEDRKKQHLKLLRLKKHPRKDFIEWYHSNDAVPELLDFRVLEECEYNVKLLNLAEIKWFNQMKPKFFGKKPSLNEKWEHSAETKKRISETYKKNNPTVKKVYKSCKSKKCDNVFTGQNSLYCSTECKYSSSKISKVNVEELERLYNSGMSLNQLAEYYKLARGSIHNIMVNNDIKRRGFSDAIKNTYKQGIRKPANKDKKI